MCDLMKKSILKFYNKEKATPTIGHSEPVYMEVFPSLLIHESFQIFAIFLSNRDSFIANVGEWQNIFDSKEPHKQILPNPWSESLTDFQRMTVIRCLRPDKVCSRKFFLI